MTPIRRLGWTALALFALVGCEPATPPATTPPTSPGTPAETAPKPPGENETKSMPVEPGKAEEPKKEGASVGKLSDDELAEIKKLPADEQPIALAQMTCPVSGDHLGEMGAPIKQTIGDKTFFLCCAGCEKAVKANPEQVLAKLKK